jgi:G6PDH family F420-dependent oxidoreductase
VSRVELGLNLGYWGTGNNADNLALAREADRLGYSVVWAAEAYGSDSPTVLAWVAAQTNRIDVGSAVMQIPARTPAMTAMTAATLDTLSGGRFRLGLGAGENLNEHVVGQRWPAVGVRHEMLAEAVDIIAALLDGERVNHRGRHFDVESARLWDRHDVRVPIGVAVSGRESCRLAGRKADLMVATEPKPELGEMFDAEGGAGKPRVGQIAVAYDADRETAVQRAHEQFRWFGLGWKVNADLPNPDAFEAATQFVTPEQVGEQLPCGPDVEEHVEKIRPFLDAGFTEVALVQIGAGEQDSFLSWAEEQLLPALRSIG